MLRFGVRRYMAKITSLSRCRLHSVSSSAEERENVQKMDKLLNAVRQCNEYVRLLVPRIENDSFQVAGPLGANREHAIFS